MHLYHYFVLQLDPSGSPDELFAVHLTSALTSSEGGAQLRNGFKIAPIEPYGVVGFSQMSRRVSVMEGQGEVKTGIEIYLISQSFLKFLLLVEKLINLLLM